MFQIQIRGFSFGKAETFRGKHNIQDRWENVPYEVMEKPYPDLQVYKDSSSKHDDQPKGFSSQFLFCINQHTVKQARTLPGKIL